VPNLGIEYDFEEASTLEELRVKISERIVQGWILSGTVRRFEVKLGDDVKETRVCQAFYRGVRTPIREAS
jgi:hypothetical protein